MQVNYTCTKMHAHGSVTLTTMHAHGLGFILIRETIKELKATLEDIRTRNPDAAKGKTSDAPAAEGKANG